MSTVLTAIFFSLIIYFGGIKADSFKTKKLWTYEITDIKLITSDKSLIDGELHTKLISRGIYGIDGFIDLKLDFDESSLIDATFLRDAFCKNDFSPMPYNYEDLSLSEFFNNQYKNLLMESAEKCAINSPIFETFEPPLTKRNITLINCQLSNENMPSHVEEGCYKAKFSVRGQAEAYIEIDVIIEKEI